MNYDLDDNGHLTVSDEETTWSVSPANLRQHLAMFGEQMAPELRTECEHIALAHERQLADGA